MSARRPAAASTVRVRGLAEDFSTSRPGSRVHAWDNDRPGVLRRRQTVRDQDEIGGCLPVCLRDPDQIDRPAPWDRLTGSAYAVKRYCQARGRSPYWQLLNVGAIRLGPGSRRPPADGSSFAAARCVHAVVGLFRPPAFGHQITFDFPLIGPMRIARGTEIAGGTRSRSVGQPRVALLERLMTAAAWTPVAVSASRPMTALSGIGTPSASTPVGNTIRASSGRADPPEQPQVHQEKIHLGAAATPADAERGAVDLRALACSAAMQ